MGRESMQYLEKNKRFNNHQKRVSTAVSGLRRKLSAVEATEDLYIPPSNYQQYDIDSRKHDSSFSRVIFFKTAYVSDQAGRTYNNVSIDNRRVKQVLHSQINLPIFVQG